MRTIFCLILLTTTVAAQTPCKPAIEHRKLDRTALQNLQVAKVNSYKEPWRLEAKEIATRECAGLKLPAAVPVRGDDRTQVFSCGAANGAHTELTLNKPEWLLPYAGTYRLMMWVVTDVKTVCAK
ncbi:MAG TPA: hypothetical protein VMU24_06790 [Candidatus Acidoferrales bacterium]|nr:hypothetical protein [Candidatus Acidoferrales bacterium]